VIPNILILFFSLNICSTC